MSNLQKMTGAILSTLKPHEVPDNEIVEQKFITLYNQIHGEVRGEMVYHKETFNFKKLLSETPALQQCTPLSLYGVFLDVAVNGLSIEGGSKPLAYVIPRNANVGSKENPVWEKRANLVISPYGELVMRIRAGHIKHADNPIIVYDGDQFSVYIDGNGKKAIRYEAVIPRKSNKIIAAFIRLTRLDGSVDFEYMTLDDVNRLRVFSEKNNRGKANELYFSDNGQIDAGFLAGKMIKHAFRTYPKIQIKGALTVTEDQVIEREVDYGIEINKATEYSDSEPNQQQLPEGNAEFNPNPKQNEVKSETF